ncbi:hypothetical protein, partial [Pseudomonas aeruginosa]|uniref:hypothetical protein n=1 Tax=Pseudomonas aeruginosa TaxID=287 RepID=UPI001F43E5F0
AGSGTAANIKGSVTRSRDNYLENRRLREPEFRKMTSPVGFLGKLGKQFTIETAGRGPTAFPYFWLKPRLM